MRPSSFIAPVEKNVELSNGAAVVITIKTKRRRGKKRLGQRGKHKARLFSFDISIFPPLVLPLFFFSGAPTHTHTFSLFFFSVFPLLALCVLALCFVRQGSGTAVVAVSGLSIGGD